MENSGIDDAWMEADVYGPATTRKILKCTHYNKSTGPSWKPLLKSSQHSKNGRNKKSQHAMYKAMMSYLHRVETILFFVASTRNADLELHLQAGEALN
ncbi:hypothetical protein KUCAC02_001794 [Chaenocephalus aceratus]|uniref:Uncharacterized protein n=1 Tax=Chaenocephalus aceratus TaxID=36190 RepID=A0ACB9XTL3_CHAAC|nr:hypothetical protein KUCAC02_001794 [Chaenocephalus aceratus]